MAEVAHRAVVGGQNKPSKHGVYAARAWFKNTATVPDGGSRWRAASWPLAPAAGPDKRFNREASLIPLRDGVAPHFAASEVTAYLRGLPGARGSRQRVLPPLSHDYGVLHERDMWAMILAELNGINLSIPADGRGPHEEIIAEVLGRIDSQ